MADDLAVEESTLPTPAPDAEARAATPVPGEKSGGLPRRRSRAFRRQLLARLPQLSISKEDAGEALQVHQDMQGIVDLDADAFLEPLERLAGDRHDRG